MAILEKYVFPAIMSQKHNKYEQQTTPKETLDFHGLGVLTEKEIKETAKNFLESCHERNLNFVAIIVGKGLHSTNGPVIGPLLRRYIPSLSFVKSCLDAPYTRGGSGCLEIRFW